MPNPSTFETDFKAGPATDLLSLGGGGFGETVSYTPLGGNASSIQAIVQRTEMQTLGPNGVRIEMQHECWVTRDDVANAKLGDSVALRKKLSDSSNTTMKVSRIIEQHGGMWHLALQ